MKSITLRACTVALLRHKLPSTASGGHTHLPAPRLHAHHPGHMLIAHLCTPPTCLCIPTHLRTHPFMQMPSHPGTRLSSTHPSSRFPPTAFLYAPCPFYRVPPDPPFMSTHTHRLHPDFQMILLVSQPAELWIIWDPFDSDAEPSKGSRESGKVESENKPGPSATAL